MMVNMMTQMQQDNVRKMKEQNRMIRQAKRRKLKMKMKIDGLGEQGLDFHEDVESDEDLDDDEDYGSEYDQR